MKGRINFKTVSVFIVAIFMFTFIFSVFAPLIRFSDNSAERRYDLVLSMIDKALVQCYAMEGSYPTTIEYLTNYGFVLDNESFYYQMTTMGSPNSNIKPSVQLFER